MVFWHRKTQTRFQFWFAETAGYGQTGAACCERKGPAAYSISFLVGFIEDLGFRRIILKCDNEPSTKSLQDAVIHACVGVEVIPQGPPEGDHMANGRVEMAVREVKRQCRTLRMSAERNTSVRIADDNPLLSWHPRFAAQVMNKMRIGKRRKGEWNEENWSKPMAQFGEKVWFRKIGEDGVSSFASRMTQEIFVGHHDRTGAVLCITKNGVMRGWSWTRQTLSEAWESTNWEGLCGTPWQLVARELKLTKKVTADKEGAGPHCQGLWLKERQKLNTEDSVECRGNRKPSTRNPLEYDQILKGGGGKFWDDVNKGYLPEDLVLAARREEIDWVHSEGVTFGLWRLLMQ